MKTLRVMGKMSSPPETCTPLMRGRKETRDEDLAEVATQNNRIENTWKDKMISICND